MGNPDVASHSLRLSLRNEKHLRVEKALKQINHKIFKSINEFTIDALDFYIKYLDGEELGIKADKGIQDSQWATKEELEAMKQAIEKNVREEVILLLGEALSGQLLQKKAVLINETVEEIEEDGITDTTAIDLVASWG
mgnify:CR=1 FL=1